MRAGARDFQEQLRYVPLLAAGVSVLLGLVILGGLLGMLRQIELPLKILEANYPFRWIKLRPFLLGPTADWFVWCASFLLSMSPSIVMLARRKTSSDPVLILTSLIFPLLSLATMSWSNFLGETLLLGSGFLAAYALVSRSGRLLGIETSFALRLVCVVVFAFLVVIATGGVVSLLLWREGAFFALTSENGLTPIDPWLSLLAVDLEMLYLARPLLSAIFIALAVAAMAVLFREPFLWIARSLSRFLIKETRPARNQARPQSASKSAMKIATRGWFPYLILAGSVALGIAITIYPYTVPQFAKFDWRTLGADYYWYVQNLRSANRLSEAIPLLRENERGFFFLLLFLIRTVTGLSPEWVVSRLTPALLSSLLALSSFMLVREGTGRLWVAAFAALLSVVSAQTALGMFTGIITNWFGLCLANFTFALIVRSMRLHSKLAAVGSIAVSFVLLGSYAYLWAVVIGEMVLALLASTAVFRTADHREWRYEVSLLGGVLIGSILIPVGFVSVAAVPLLGFRTPGLDPAYWFGLGWNYLTRGLTVGALGAALAALEEAFGFAGNRIALPFLTLLSVFGLLNGASQTRLFERIISATILLPFVMTIMASGLFDVTLRVYATWRGLYLIPLYLAGALGAESIIHRVNGQESSWSSRGRLAFAGMFGAYVFLSLLGYSLRALEFLIMVAL